MEAPATRPQKKGGRQKTEAALARESVGLTPEQLAPRARISAAHLRNVERDGCCWVTADRLTRAIRAEARKMRMGEAEVAKIRVEMYIHPRGNVGPRARPQDDRNNKTTKTTATASNRQGGRVES